jgi:hypothetical protein
MHPKEAPTAHHNTFVTGHSRQLATSSTPSNQNPNILGNKAITKNNNQTIWIWTKCQQQQSINKTVHTGWNHSARETILSKISQNTLIRT